MQFRFRCYRTPYVHDTHPVTFTDPRPVSCPQRYTLANGPSVV